MGAPLDAPDDGGRDGVPGAYAWPILDPGLSDGWRLACHVATWVTWALFFVDYVVRIVLSTQRWRFVRTHVFDLLVVLLPLFRPLGLLRLVAALSVLDRYAGTTLRGRVAVYIATRGVAGDLRGRAGRAPGRAVGRGRQHHASSTTPSGGR